MDTRFLHIIAFNVPYPPDYGGVIDVYYKIKALQEKGIRIILHCYTYGRQPSKELESLCYKVFYYRRKSGLRYFLNRLPYITATRRSNIMPNNVLDDHFPVLFEGLHSTFLLRRLKSANKLLVIRAHNVEHEYYRKLAASERNLFHRFFLFSESIKLRRYESVISDADHVLGISDQDTAYFEQTYGNAIHIPAFHPSDEVDILKGRGDYLLYHGNLSVAENIEAASYLIRKVFSRISIPVIIAGKSPSPALTALAARYPHIKIEGDPDEGRMRELIRHAHIHLLFTFQSTGIKLKLLHTLFSGRHIIVNPDMTSGSPLAALCHTATDPDEAVHLIGQLMQADFTDEDIRFRKKNLEPYLNRVNAEKIVRLLYRGG